MVALVLGWRGLPEKVFAAHGVDGGYGVCGPVGVDEGVDCVPV